MLPDAVCALLIVFKSCLPRNISGGRQSARVRMVLNNMRDNNVFTSAGTTADQLTTRKEDSTQWHAAHPMRMRQRMQRAHRNVLCAVRRQNLGDEALLDALPHHRGLVRLNLHHAVAGGHLVAHLLTCRSRSVGGIKLSDALERRRARCAHARRLLGIFIQ